MRMHTIPQNVTAYEDRIVGMLVGRQFIYLAVGGVVIFILLSTNIGPIFIRAFISMLIAGFAAALALFKPNDRNFDGLILSYVQAIFGPTEWVWRKDQPPIEKLRLITDQLAGKPPANVQNPSFKASRTSHDNLLQVSRFQTFVSERESGIDNDELDFIEQLNFNEPVPQKAFITAASTEKAPPMLTRNNYGQFKSNPVPPPAPIAPPHNQPKPLTALAGNSNQLGATVTIQGRQQDVHLRRNLRTNRSLSRQLLNSGVMTLPIRGERQIDLSNEFKDELKQITSYIQSTSAPPTPSTTPTTSQPAPVSTTTVATPPPIAAPTPETTQTSQPIRRFSDYDNSGTPSISRQISMLGQALPNSGITKGSPMSDTTSSPTPPNNQASPSQPSSVKVIPNSSLSSSSGLYDSDLEQEARQVEAEAQKGISQLNQPATPASQPTTTTTESIPATNIQQSLAQAAPTTEIKPQPQTQPTVAPPTITNQPANSHPQYLPVPQVAPVIPEQPEPAPALSSPPASTPTAATPPLKPAAPTSTSELEELDLQAKMAAAGVGSTEPAAATNPQPAVNPTNDSSAATQKTVALTNQPNIINGTVVDAQGQLVPGVIVVVKNAQGESKRALKTNKLGQFVVTTPLANGTYSVEVDKKGLSFDIMKVELTGTVLPPISIKSKSG